MNVTALKDFILKLKKDKKAFFAVIIAFMGIMLIFLSEITFTEEETEKDGGNDTPYMTEAELSCQVSDLLETIDGAGKVRVMLTYECREEIIYAVDGDISEEKGRESSSSTKHIVIDSENGEQGLMQKVVLPKVKGVAVVCQGGADPVIKEQIISLVSALFDISSNKISIAVMA